MYDKILNILKKNNLISENIDNDSHKQFKKVFFCQWYKKYKEYIKNGEIVNILKKFELKKSIFRNFICANLNC